MSDSTKQGEGEIDTATVDVNPVNQTKVFWSDSFLTRSTGKGSNSVWCNSIRTAW